MRIYDPIYGAFELSRFAEELVHTPEFRRLSQIRLLNTLSPTLATLGEIRRYSHTLGVLFLNSKWLSTANDFSKDETDALQASIILHDIGTPPFGHLLEYIFKDNFGWDHESAIEDLLKGWHVASNVAHQIFGGRTGRVIQLLRNRNLSIDLLMKILKKDHPLSQLILGTFDFDNIDNVVRMAWALGLLRSPTLALELASNISVDRNGNLLFPSESRFLVSEWLRLRRDVYDVIVFDASTVAAQAVLTKALLIALEEHIINLEDWVCTDEQLLSRLTTHNETKNLVNLNYLGTLPRALVIAQFSGINLQLAEAARSDITKDLELIATGMGVEKPLGYVFKEKGAFEKQLQFRDPHSGELWSLGETSSSVIIYLFTSSSAEVSIKTLNSLVLEFADKWHLLPIELRRLIINDKNMIGSQENGEIDFTAR